MITNVLPHFFVNHSVYATWIVHGYSIIDFTPTIHYNFVRRVYIDWTLGYLGYWDIGYWDIWEGFCCIL